MVKMIHAVMLFILATVWLPVAAQSEGLGDLFNNAESTQQSKFLPVEQAFSVSANTSPTKAAATLNIEFDITPGHYVYKDKIKLALPAGVTAAPIGFNQPVTLVDDPQFGRVPVFDQRSVTATTTLTNSSASSIDNAAVTITWQGCAKAGLCYPPEKIKTTVSLAGQAKATNKVTKSVAADSQKSQPADTAKASAKKSEKGIAAKDEKQVALGNSSPSVTTSALSATRDQVDVNKPSGASEQQSKGVDESNDALSSSATVEGQLSDSDTQDDSAIIAAAIEENAALGGDERARQSQIQPDDAALSMTDRGDNSSGQNEALVNPDPFGLGTHPWLALGLLFLAGLGLAFTPCVLPMLPIVANIVGNQSNPTPKKAAILTTSYALGVAIAYGILGALIAVFGQSLGIIGWLQNPIILLSFAAVFVLLALYMLDLVPLRLPFAVRNKLTAFSDKGSSRLGSAGGSLIAGFLSALVVSPCVSAPLFGALLAVSTIGNPLLGFAALFVLGFGLSAPLIVLGTTQGSLMPKAGEWMNWVKQGFALLLFAVALLLVERVFVSTLMLLVWALWFMVVAVWAWQWRHRGLILTRALGLIAGVWSVVLIVGAALGNSDSLHPLASLSMLQSEPTAAALTDRQTVDVQAQKVTTLAALDAITASSPKVVVDVTADWCIECRIMDKALFAMPPAQLSGWQVVKLDITETSADSKAILARYQLFGPPALLYYVNGELVAQQVGETDRSDFVEVLTRLQP